MTNTGYEHDSQLATPLGAAGYEAHAERLQGWRIAQIFEKGIVRKELTRDVRMARYNDSVTLFFERYVHNGAQSQLDALTQHLDCPDLKAITGKLTDIHTSPHALLTLELEGTPFNEGDVALMHKVDEHFTAQGFISPLSAVS